MSQITMADALKTVATMDLAGLARVYKRVVGAKPPRGTNLETLKDALFDALKEQTTMEGDVEVLNDSAAKWLAEGDGKKVETKTSVAPEAKPEKPIKVKKEPKPAKEPRPLDERLPAVGEVIQKRWRERDLEVKVLADGFEFEGRTYKSLSKVASELQGCSSNGFLFFGLTAGAKAAAARRVEREAAKATESEPVAESKPEKKQRPAKQVKAKGTKKSKAKSK